MERFQKLHTTNDLYCFGFYYSCWDNWYLSSSIILHCRSMTSFISESWFCRLMMRFSFCWHLHFCVHVIVWKSLEEGNREGEIGRWSPCCCSSCSNSCWESSILKGGGAAPCLLSIISPKLPPLWVRFTLFGVGDFTTFFVTFHNFSVPLGQLFDNVWSAFSWGFRRLTSTGCFACCTMGGDELDRVAMRQLRLLQVRVGRNFFCFVRLQ